MKCPQCGHNHPKKLGQVCSNCRYQFVFRPDADNGMTDGKFTAMIRTASANDTYYFTENQLYTAYCRKNKWFSPVLPAIFLLIVGIIVFISGVCMFFLIYVPIVIGLVYFYFRGRNNPPPRDQFDTAVRKWIQRRGPIDKLIREPALHNPPPDWDEPDVYDYGVEKILIVNRDILVDLLVRNNFHAEQRTLVVSANGYPSYLMPRVTELLSQNPELPVFLLHDSTESGRRAGQPRYLHKFPDFGSRPVIDLGIHPEDVPKIKRIRATRPQAQNNAVPVDLILYAALAGMTAEAILQMAPLSESVLTAAESSVFSGSFG